MNRVDAVSTVASGVPDDVLLTCGSFEDRCVGVLERLDSEYRVGTSVVVELESRIRGRGSELRRENVETLRAGFAPRSLQACEFIVASAHNPFELTILLSEALGDVLHTDRRLRITLDITCFTRVQLLNVLRWMFLNVHEAEVQLLYATPARYVTLDPRRPDELASGYERLLVMPYEIGRGSFVRGVEQVEMIVLLGHEGVRTLHAWSESEPTDTLLILATSDLDPELGIVAERQNDFLIQRAKDGAPGFRLETWPNKDMAHAVQQFSRILDVENHKREPQRFGFVPSGPKPLVAAFALSSFGSRHCEIDIVYPVPRSYSANYSSGLEDVFAFPWVVCHGE